VPETALNYRRMPTSDLQIFGGNPRRGNVDEIVKSLEKHGQFRPIVVNAGTHTGRPNEVLAGNHTLMAARQLGWPDLDVSLVDVSEDMARSIVLADNRLADLGSYDDRELLALLESLDDIEGTGYSDDDLDALTRDLYPEEPLTDPDDAPEVRDDALSQPGQIWTLGKHRLLVGDATDLLDVARLVDDDHPDCVWTDPPYGVGYVGKTKDALTIQNDGAGGLEALLNESFTVLAAVCKPGAPVYVAHPPGPDGKLFDLAMTEAGLLVRQTLIWIKNAMVLGRSDYHYKHEPILYGFAPANSGRLGRGGERWFGDNAQTTVFEFDKPARNGDHPTMKPVALIDAMLANSLPPGGTVFDPFAGSGSTLIAAHGRGGRALCVELDPRYADVILRRFEQHTGIVPKLDGRPVSFVQQEVSC
jgi:DNA modification methylase